MSQSKAVFAMPRFQRLLIGVLVAGGLAACSAQTASAPPLATTPVPTLTALPMMTATPTLTAAPRLTEARPQPSPSGSPRKGPPTFVPTLTASPVGAATTTPIALTSRPTPAPLVQRIASPDGKYFIEMATDGTRLYRAADMSVLSQAPVPIDPTWNEITWAPNSSEAFASDFQHSYLWLPNGKPPREVPAAMLTVMTWAPDGSRLAAVEDHPSSAASEFVIVDINGRVKRISNGSRSFALDQVYKIRWLTTSIVEVWEGGDQICSIYLYFDADAAKQFPDALACWDVSQPVLFSPNVHWRVTDTEYRVWEGEPYASPNHFAHVYRVLSFKTGQEFQLYDGADQYLDWVGWTPDSATFYFVNRPASATAVAGPDLPFGLIALNPATHGVQMLFAQAVYARLGADQTLACVIFPAKRADGKLGLDAGVFNLAAQTLTGRQAVSDEFSYPAPDSQDAALTAWADATQSGCK